MLTIGELEDEIKLQNTQHINKKEIDPMKYMVDDAFIEQVLSYLNECESVKPYFVLTHDLYVNERKHNRAPHSH